MPVPIDVEVLDNIFFKFRLYCVPVCMVNAIVFTEKIELDGVRRSFVSSMPFYCLIQYEKFISCGDNVALE